MKDNNNHIIKRIATDSLESWIQYIMEISQIGKYKIQYRCEMSQWYTVLENHLWNFYDNEYQIVKPREYIISINKGEPCIVETSNCWSSSDFATNADGTQYFLMSEVEH